MDTIKKYLLEYAVIIKDKYQVSKYKAYNCLEDIYSYIKLGRIKKYKVFIIGEEIKLNIKKLEKNLTKETKKILEKFRNGEKDAEKK